MWIKSCGLNEQDNVKSVFLCSQHFTIDDYIDINARQYGGQIKLKSSAFPTINVPISLEPPSLINMMPSTSDYRHKTDNINPDHYQTDPSIVHTAQKRNLEFVDEGSLATTGT